MLVCTCDSLKAESLTACLAFIRQVTALIGYTRKHTEVMSICGLRGTGSNDESHTVNNIPHQECK